MALSDSIKEKILAEITFSASRSSGPGGQHVNKVNTQVELRFQIEGSAVLDERQKQLLMAKLKNRINGQGELIITSKTERTQWRNRENGIQKFFDLVEQALKKTPKRIKTRPTGASRLKRLENKKQRSLKKDLRRPPEWP
jgi:ribosome-associated protein